MCFANIKEIITLRGHEKNVLVVPTLKNAPVGHKKNVCVVWT